MSEKQKRFLAKYYIDSDLTEEATGKMIIEATSFAEAAREAENLIETRKAKDPIRDYGLLELGVVIG